MAGSGVTGVFEREPKSGIWWIRWTDHEGKRHLEKIGRKSDAITMIGKRRADSHLHKKLPETIRGRITFGELAKDAVAHSHAENGERSTKELELKLGHILEDFASRSASSITAQDITSWIKAKGEEREWSSATMNRYQAAFSLIFRVGIKKTRKITTNPAQEIKRRKENKGRVRFLSGDEERRIAEALSSQYANHSHAFTISINTGLRAGEQWRLVWADVDTTSKVLTVRQLAKRKPGRKVPINKAALAAFKALRQAYPSTPDYDDPVFLNSDGKPLRRHREWFDSTIKACGVKDYTWHGNRHTFASRLVMSGVNLIAVKELMGHQSITMTDRYSHLIPGHNASAVELLGNREW